MFLVSSISLVPIKLVVVGRSHICSGFSTPDHGSLVGWAEQGVFMLNATLTVK